MHNLKERVEVQKRFSIADCSANMYKLYIFGDNLIRVGKGGQAIIRDCFNAYGIPTKRFPTMKDNAFFSDGVIEEKTLLYELNNLLDIYTTMKNITLVFPEDGLGTGLAQMPTRSPKLYKLMNDFIYENFGIKYG